MTIYQRAVKTFGRSSQIGMMAEECAEVIQAISKVNRYGKSKEQDLIEELADVEIMLEQMKVIFGWKEIEDAKIQKLKRLEIIIEGI